jgi:hypothetical protein
VYTQQVVEFRAFDEPDPIVEREAAAVVVAEPAVVTKMAWFARLLCMTPASARTSLAGTTWR